MKGKTHREAATLIAHSGQSVAMRLHRPYDSSWLEPSRDAYRTTNHRHGIVREESSTAIFLESQSLSLSGAPVDLSAIREVTESPSLFDRPLLSELITTPLDDDEKDDVSLDLPESIADRPPDLPEEGPPLDESFECLSKRASLLLSVPPHDDILSSISEPHIFSDTTTEGSGLAEVRSELLLIGGVAEEEGTFTVTLKKGFRGLDFALNGDLSGQPGEL